VVLAQDEAQALKHNYIGTEHLLLGLLREEEGVAARVLEGLGITVEEVRAQVARIIGPGDEPAIGQIPFTPRAKKVLELALREAMTLGHNYIGTEHVLLGVVRENEGVAARILLDFDADAETVRNAVIRVLSPPGTVSEEPSRRDLLERIRAQKDAAVAAGHMERAAQLRDEEERLQAGGFAMEVTRRRPRHEYAPALSAIQSVSFVLGWLLFGVSLGLGILIGWAIWGL
jgi:ATP-dependent Clp protease ATP-binding subunit ClpA